MEYMWNCLPDLLNRILFIIKRLVHLTPPDNVENISLETIFLTWNDWYSAYDKR